MKLAIFMIMILFSSFSLTTAMMRQNSIIAISTDIHVLTDSAYAQPANHSINRADSIRANSNSFVGPSPMTIHFVAEMDEQPFYCSWEIASDNKFQDIVEQFRNTIDQSLCSKISYTFEESGTYYVRFVADFKSNTDDVETVSYATSTPYQIQITESLLEIPNLITPDQAESRNNTFYVRYKSLISYEIWIYNRWGQEIFHSTDPAEGWDGRFNGETVPTGAYYYLVKAEGSEGISYNRKGSINVLKTRR